jgi:hypothetical protein
LIYAAIRLHARTTGDAARAIAAIEPYARVEWNGNGKPTLRDSSALRDGAIALADLLILDGQVERGHRLLAEIISTMERETRGEGRRPELWYLREHPKALALDGQPDAALALLERSYAIGQATSAWWFSVEAEPAYDALRKTRGSRPCAARSGTTSPNSIRNSRVCARKAWCRSDRAVSNKRKSSSAAAFAWHAPAHGRLCWCSASENLT